MKASLWAPTKQHITPAIIIPAAGLGRRMKSYGPKALIRCANDEPLICRQIRLCREVFKNPWIVVVVGFGADRIRKVLPSCVTTINNEQYENTNVAYSIATGLTATPPWLPALILYGDLVFNKELLKAVDLSQSSIVLDPNRGRETEVGVTVVSDKATVFSYGLPSKWAHVATLLPAEQALFMKLMSEPHRRKHFGYEVLNEILERGGPLAANTLAGIKLVEVDCSKDINRARAIQ